MIISLIINMIRGYQWFIILLVAFLVFLPYIRKCVKAFQDGMNGDEKKSR